MVDPAVKPNLLKKEEANECDEDEGCRANIRTGQECVNDKTDKEQSSEMDAESVNTDSEMFDPRCRPSEKTSEKPIELNKQENDDDDSELSAPAVIASASHSSGVVGVLVAMQRHAPVTQTAQETIEHEPAILAGIALLGGTMRDASSSTSMRDGCFQPSAIFERSVNRTG